jgi:hypothetical protein
MLARYVVAAPDRYGVREELAVDFDLPDGASGDDGRSRNEARKSKAGRPAPCAPDRQFSARIGCYRSRRFVGFALDLSKDTGPRSERIKRTELWTATGNRLSAPPRSSTSPAPATARPPSRNSLAPGSVARVGSRGHPIEVMRVGLFRPVLVWLARALALVHERS